VHWWQIDKNLLLEKLNIFSPPVSLIPPVTGGKFSTDVNDTCGTKGKFSTDVVDTNSEYLRESEKNLNYPYVIHRGLREDDS
jgi:hypothetical protein